MIKKRKSRGSLLYIMIISVVLLLAALSISLITSFMLGGAKKNVLKNQARFTAKSVAAQTLFRMDLANSVMVKRMKNQFEGENNGLFRIQDVNWGGVISQSCDRKMVFPKSPAEKGKIPLNSFGGFTVNVNFNGGRYSSVDNLNGMEPALFPYTGKKEVTPYSLSVLINLENKGKNAARHYSLEIGKQWDYAVSTFDAPLKLEGYSKITGDIASFYNPDKGQYNPFCIVFTESADPLKASSILRGNMCTSNPPPRILPGSGITSTSSSDPIFVDDKVLDRWTFGDKVYGIPQINAQYLKLLNFLTVPAKNETTFDLVPEMNKNGFAKSYFRPAGMKITNPDLWGNSALATFFDTLGAPELPPAKEDNSNKPKSPPVAKPINFVELHKPLRLCGDVKNDPDVISGHSDYVIDGCVVAQGDVQAGEKTEYNGPIPGIELENCKLTINGDLYLSAVKMFISNVPEEEVPSNNSGFAVPGNLGEATVPSGPDRITGPLAPTNGSRPIKPLTPEQVANAPGIKGKNSALIVKGNIFLMNAKMENSGLNFVIYSTRNILLRPVEKSGDVIFCGAVVAQGNIYIVPMKYTELTRKALSSDIVTVKGCIACSGTPVPGSIYDEVPPKGSIEENNPREDYQKGIVGLNLNTINVQYDASATGLLNSIAGWPRIKSWRELY